MRNDGVAVATLKQQLYRHTITPDQYDAAIAPIRAAHGLIFDFWNIHWLYYTQILFVVTAMLVIVISLATPAPDAKVRRFTWYGASPGEKAGTRGSWSASDIVLSLTVLAAVVTFYITFW
jgi:SSS family solute:Na+ symporter